MEKRISIIGGDLRICYLAKLLVEKGFTVYTYGLEKAEIIQNENRILKLKELNDALDISNVIISSIPLMQDEENIKATYSINKIKACDILKNMKSKTLIAGKIPKDFSKYEKENNIQLIDLIESEELAILNSISTAEGAIKIAIEETNITLHGSNCLILGFGRIGKMLAKMLQGFGANVYCEARKKSDLAWIKALGYKEIELDNLDYNLANKQIIFNTIPSIILNEDRLKLLSKDTIIIDLASKPGGIDRDFADKMKIKNIWALAIPRKNSTM